MSARRQDGRFALGRREFVAASAGALVVAAIPAATRRRTAVKRTIPVMGTLAEFTVVHRDERIAEAAIDRAVAALRDVERRMTRFRNDSEVGQANLGAHLAPVAVSAETHAVVAAGVRWAEASAGAFDPAIGRVVELWDVAHAHEPPRSEAVHRLARRHFYRKIQLGTERGRPSIFFADQDVHLDLGAIAKGYGVDRAIDALRAAGIANGLVDVGGEVAAIGGASGDEPWRIGIADPADPRVVRATVELTDGAIATSGDYEQFFRWRGHRYHHLMDPDTAAPRETPMHSVTIRAGCCMDADAAATATYGMTRGDAQRLLDRMSPGAQVIDMA
ncbi:MAG: FAD:protein FMN transferase [Gemmatimonadaceae bacterium]